MTTPTPLHRPSPIFSEQDADRLRGYLERLGEVRVRARLAADPARFFGDWQAQDIVLGWLSERKAERSPPQKPGLATWLQTLLRKAA